MTLLRALQVSRRFDGWNAAPKGEERPDEILIVRYVFGSRVRPCGQLMGSVWLDGGEAKRTLGIALYQCLSWTKGVP